MAEAAMKILSAAMKLSVRNEFKSPKNSRRALMPRATRKTARRRSTLHEPTRSIDVRESCRMGPSAG